MGNYIPATETEKREMLDFLGLSSVDELFSVIPEEVRAADLNLPEGLSEMKVRAKVEELAALNQRFRHCFRGAGAYRHYIPSMVKTVVSREEFVTAYTPYQAEISQGILQSIFEYQTQMCELTGMDVSNASVYDGATAAAEAVFMCEERKRSGVLAAATANPQVLAVMNTYCESRGVKLTTLAEREGRLDTDVFAAALKAANPASVYIQQPNFYGILEEVDTIVALAHEVGVRVIMGVNPISLGLLKTPGEYGADIAVGEGQPLGLPLGFGGPYLGFMTCKKELMRKLPGRIVGETTDADGNRCFVLTLQAREQHIRREKASSNICSNEALCAMTASVYLASMGPAGLRRAAENSAAHAHYLAARLGEIPGFALRYNRPYFHEFLTECPVDPEKLCKKLAQKDILGGLPVEGGILWCCTELNSKAEIDEMVSLIKEVCA